MKFPKDAPKRRVIQTLNTLKFEIVRVAQKNKRLYPTNNLQTGKNIKI